MLVAGVAGEQFAVNDAVERLRQLRDESGEQEFQVVSAADPLNLKLHHAAGRAADALAAALDEIVRRHEALRTVLPAQGGEPVQRVLPAAARRRPVADLSRLDGERAERELSRQADAEAARPFDLAHGPLLRFRRVLLPAGQALLLTQHHVVSDGWSMGVLLREWGRLYGAFRAGMPSPLPELPVQYGDYAVWQRRRLSGDALAAELEHWRARLDGVPVLELPTDRPRGLEPRRDGGFVPLSLPEESRRALAALAHGSGATLYMALLATFQAVLARHSGQADFAVGTPAAGRTHGDLEGLIGFFVNTLVMRADLSRDPSFGELLKRTRTRVLDAYEHQEMPFERLVAELVPQRHPGITPLFQVLLALQNTPEREPAKLAGLRLEPISGRLESAKFDLMLMLSSSHDGLVGGFEYDRSLFDRATVTRWADQWRRLVAAAAAAPDLALSALPLLSAGERHQLLVEWARGPRPARPEASISEAFLRQVERTPHAVALVFGDAAWSYRELARRSAATARELRRRGVGRETRVGVWMERSPELVIAVLAILEAGGAYVPLDPSYPDERLAWMIEDSRAALVLTSAGIGTGISFEELAASAAGGDGPLGALGDPDALAYVMYTSGSTGQPKGVEVPHRGVLRLVRDESYARFGAGQTFLQLSPISFDASTLEIWGALLTGGRLVLPCTETLSLASLGEEIRRRQVSTLWLTAGLFHEMVEAHLEDLARSGRLVLLDTSLELFQADPETPLARLRQRVHARHLDENELVAD